MPLGRAQDVNKLIVNTLNNFRLNNEQAVSSEWRNQGRPTANLASFNYILANWPVNLNTSTARHAHAHAHTLAHSHTHADRCVSVCIVVGNLFG